MKIEKITLIEFNEVKERERILRGFKRAKQKRFQPWLLAILDAFITSDWDKAVDLMRNPPEREDDPPLEYVHPVIYSTLREYVEVKNARASADQCTDDISGEEAEVLALTMAMKGLPTGPERFDYPKFRVVAHEAASAA